MLFDLASCVPPNQPPPPVCAPKTCRRSGIPADPRATAAARHPVRALRAEPRVAQRRAQHLRRSRMHEGRVRARLRLVADGCGGTLMCPPCAAGKACGGGGPNLCGTATCNKLSCPAAAPAACAGRSRTAAVVQQHVRVPAGQPVRERRLRGSAVHAAHLRRGRRELRAGGKRLRRSPRLRQLLGTADLWWRRPREHLRRRRSLKGRRTRDHESVASPGGVDDGRPWPAGAEQKPNRVGGNPRGFDVAGKRERPDVHCPGYGIVARARAVSQASAARPRIAKTSRCASPGIATTDLAARDCKGAITAVPPSALFACASRPVARAASSDTLAAKHGRRRAQACRGGASGQPPPRQVAARRAAGSGRHGWVYAATHRNKNRVALKILHPEFSRTRTSRPLPARGLRRQHGRAPGRGRGLRRRRRGRRHCVPGDGAARGVP